MKALEVKRIKPPEEKNASLRKLLTEAILDKELLQVAPGQKF
jgi:putative transposase